MGSFFTLVLFIGLAMFLAVRLVNSLRTGKFVAVRLYLPESIYDRYASPAKYWAAIAVMAIVALALTFDIAVQIWRLFSH